MRSLMLIIFLFCLPVHGKSINLSVISKSVTQGPDQLIWIGIEGDIVRYDGHRLLYLSTLNPDFPQQTIYSIRRHYQDLIATGDFGIYQIHNTEVMPLLETKEPVLDAIFFNGKLYFLTLSHLYSYDENRGIYEIGELDGHGRRLLIINKQLYFLSTGNFCKLQSYCLNGSFIEATHVDNTIVVSAQDKLIVIDADTDQQQELPYQNVRALTPSVDSTAIWMLQNRQIKHFDLETRQFTPHNYRRQHNNIASAIYQSSDETLWIASTQLEQIHSSPFINQPTTLPSSTGVGSGMINHKGHLFYGDDFGLAEINPANGKATVVTHAPKHVYALRSTPESLFVGAFSGLYRMDLPTHSPEETPVENMTATEITDPVLCIRHFDDTTLIICHGNRLSSYDRRTHEITDVTKTLLPNQSHEITDIISGAHDDESATYIATGSGLYVFESGKNPQHIYPRTSFITLYQTRRNPNLIIAGTINSGIKLFESGSELNKRLLLSELSGKCTSITETEQHAWVSCSGGLARIDLNSLETQVFPLSTAVSGAALSYKKGHTTLHAVTAEKTLLSWSDKLEDRTFDPEILFTSLFIQGERSDFKQPWYEGTHIELDFTLNDFHPGNIFSVNVNGESLRRFSERHSIGFNAEYGDNTIEVIGRNSTGATNSRTIVLSIAEPFYLHWSFYIILLVLVLAIAQAIYMAWQNARRNTLSGIEGFLNEYVGLRQHLSSQIFADVNKLKSMTPGESENYRVLNSIHARLADLPHYCFYDKDNNLETNIHSWKSHKIELTHAFNQSMTLENQRALNANTLALEKLNASKNELLTRQMPVPAQIDEMNQKIMNLLKKEENLRTLIDNPESQTLDIDVDYQLNAPISQRSESLVFLLVELIGNNAVEHGEATTIKINLTSVDDQLMITIQDNGVGYKVIQSPHDELDGGSMFIIKTIVKLLDGKLSFYSPGIHQGTRVTVLLPLQALQDQ